MVDRGIEGCEQVGSAVGGDQVDEAPGEGEWGDC